MSSNQKIVIGVVVVLAVAIVAGALWWGCGKLNPTPPPTPPAPTATATATPCPAPCPPPAVTVNVTPTVTAVLPPPPPPDPDELQPSDVQDFCKSAPNKLRWVFVWPDTGTDGTMVVKVCHNQTWTAKRDRRVTFDGRTLRVAEGEGSSVVTLKEGPLGDGWETMESKFGKTVLVGKYEGQPIELSGNALLVLLPPATQAPPEVFLGECEDMARRFPEPPPAKDWWLREIWARCKLGDKKNVAVARTMASACSSSSCFSRQDGAALAAQVKRIESAVSAAGNQPVPPQTVGYDPSAPSR